MEKSKQVITFSGGKDSTAMLLMMIERKEEIHSIIYFDTGWEFPQMKKHIELVQSKTGVEILILRPDKPFNYWLTNRATHKMYRI